MNKINNKLYIIGLMLIGMAFSSVNASGMLPKLMKPILEKITNSVVKVKASYSGLAACPTARLIQACGFPGAAFFGATLGLGAVSSAAKIHESYVMGERRATLEWLREKRRNLWEWDQDKQPPILRCQ